VSYQPQFDWTAWDFRSVIERDKPPPSIRSAVRLMLAGAAVEALALILELLAYGSFLHTDIGFVQLTPGQLHLAEDIGWAYLLVTGLTRTGMWLWMAAKNQAGRRWARVLSTVFFGIYSLGLAYDFFRGVPGSDPLLLFPVAIWLVGAGVIALLWKPESSEFFGVRSHRYY
jgi:hypothetical protein